MKFRDLFAFAAGLAFAAAAHAKKALESTDLRARLYVQGLAPVGDTPEEMGRAMKEETQLWARVVRERKIQVK